MRVNWGGESGERYEPLSVSCRGRSPLIKCLGSKEHLDWLKIYLNAAKQLLFETITHEKLMWMTVHIYSIKATKDLSPGDFPKIGDWCKIYATSCDDLAKV